MTDYVFALFWWHRLKPAATQFSALIFPSVQYSMFDVQLVKNGRGLTTVNSTNGGFLGLGPTIISLYRIRIFQEVGNISSEIILTNQRRFNRRLKNWPFPRKRPVVTLEKYNRFVPNLTRTDGKALVEAGNFAQHFGPREEKNMEYQ